MLELRKDYILDRWVIISSERGMRPDKFKSKEVIPPQETSIFSPGNENKTPPEIGRIEKEGKWVMRWFPNKFVAARLEGQKHIETHNNYYTFSSSYGAHEIIVETPDPNRQLWDFSAEEIAQLLDVYKQRVLELEKIDHIGYVHCFKNHGKQGGASLIHSHTQVIATNHITVEVRMLLEALKQYDYDPYTDIIANEMAGDRKCFENDAFVAFCPYASRFNFEVLLLPKESLGRFEELDLAQLAELLEKILKKLKELGCAYNISYLYAPPGETMRFHVRVMPRIARWAGYELSSGEIINVVPPEDAAAFYRS